MLLLPTLCAEAVAIGMAAAAGDTEIQRIVAVSREGRVVSPCGSCREMITDYAPDARVIVPGETGPEVIPVAELLPLRYRKDGRPRWHRWRCILGEIVVRTRRDRPVPEIEAAVPSVTLLSRSESNSAWIQSPSLEFVRLRY